MARAKRTGATTLNPNRVSAWLPGRECVWKHNGVWTDAGGQPRLLRPGHLMQEVDGKL